MKARFITNGVLSLLTFIGWILLIVAAVKLSSNEGYYETDAWGNRNWVNDDTTITSAGFGLVGILFIAIGSLASLVMGIVTLAMIGGANQRGLGIASGVLGILGGLFGINAIVSFIGAAKENS